MSTLDLANLPRTPEGTIDFAQDFFGREAFLTVSGQLNVEAYCLALTKVYTFGPTFRAENSNTSRHLAEFWMIEPEIAFADLDDATLAERLLKFTLEKLLEQRQDDLAFFDERIEKGLLAKLAGIVSSEFVRMDYGEAIAVLERAKEKFEFPVKWGVDLQSEHERYLTEKKHAKKPVIVMNYPKDIKAFYMRVNDDGRTVAAMDVLAPSARSSAAASARSGLMRWTRAWRSAASTRSITPGTAICAAMARCRTPASASASSAPLLMSPASPMCATRSRSRERPDMRDIDAAALAHRACVCRRWFSDPQSDPGLENQRCSSNS